MPAFGRCVAYYPGLSSFMNYHWVCNKNNMMGATYGPGTPTPSEAHEFAPGF